MKVKTIQEALSHAPSPVRQGDLTMTDRRPTTTPSSCGATTMAAASELCLVEISQDTSRKTVLFVKLSLLESL